MKIFLTKSFVFFLSVLFLFPTNVLALTPNDTHISTQWYLDQINAFDAWDITTGSNEVVVAVVDAGVDINHPDLIDQIWLNPGEVPGDGIDNDNNGFIDDVNGWDFADQDADISSYTGGEYDEAAVAHGTVIAGVIGAMTNNVEGIAGINWNVKIMPIRILDQLGTGNSQSATNAIRYATEQKVDVINLSFTGFEFDLTFKKAIREAYEAGVVVVAAVGNMDGGGTDVNRTPVYPACFNGALTDWVLGVASTNKEDKKSDFSNYGSNCVDLSAPGEEILGAVYQDSSDPVFEEAYAGYWSGTSLAAPMVAGAAALLKSRFPTLTVGQIRTVLQLSADPLAEKNTSAAGNLGTGRLNILKALEIANAFADPVEDTGSTQTAPSNNLIAVEAQGGTPLVKRLNAQGETLESFMAYADAFKGGVRIATADVNADGELEIITVPGPGGGPHVRIFSLNGTLIDQFFAFPQDYRFGLFVGVGDIDFDGIDEILISEDEGGNGEVRAFGASGVQKRSYFPFGETKQSIRVAAGDIDGDKKDELVFGLGRGGAPLVRVFEANGKGITTFTAYASTYDKGIFVGVGDVNGDGKEEIVTGTDNGGGPHVRIFDQNGKVQSSFFAYDEFFRGGVRIAVGDIDGNGTAEIYTAAGPGGGPHARIFNQNGSVIGGFFVFDTEKRNGINLAL